MQPFDRFVDVEQIKAIFQQELPECRKKAWVITDCAILHAHYHTSAKHWRKARLNICYQLRGVDTVRQMPWTQLFYGRARVDGQSITEFILAQKASFVMPIIGQPLLHLPEHDVTFWSFPTDPQLPHLPLVVDADKVKSYLPSQVLPDSWAENPLSQQVTVEIVHYYPEERCTLRYYVHGGNPAQPQRITLIGKTFRDERGTQIYRRMQEAWQQSLAQPGHFRVAQPLAYTAAIKTIWIRHEAGTPLLHVINAANAEHLLSSVARGLVALQRSEFSDTKAIIVDDQVHELQSKVQKLSHALPALAALLQAMVERLCREVESFTQPTGQLIHGDFHIRQLLVDQGEIIFLDFDEFALGDPLQDVANFIVDLHFEGFPLPLVRTMAQHFVQAYGAYADWDIPSARLQWHIRYQFLTRAYRFYRQHRLNLHEEVQQVLAFAEENSATILTTQRRTLALFPGAFRPPHEAHFAAVRDLATRPEVDEVVVIIANRSRLIPGTAKALDADVAREVWSIYLRHLPKVRVEVAAHSAIAHALGYFDRVAAGDTLLFCIGEADLGRGDERFEELQVLSARTGVIATVVPAPTGSLQVRATTLRATLANGEAGRLAFIAALPLCLSADERADVWSICHSGLREMSEVIKEKVRRLIGCQESAIAEFHCVNQGKADPVFRAHLCDGRTLFVKYAGDTVEAGRIGEPLTPKPRKRLAVERRAINCLRANQGWWENEDSVEIPEVVHFDKETVTLVLSEVCLGGQPLQAQLEAANFAVKTAKALSHCLAAWHGMATQVVPLWGSEADDRRHWQRMLALRTVDIPVDILSHQLQRAVATLQRQSEQASVRGFYHLDFCPKNILIDRGHSGVIDLELSASVGDPAYDFGILLGHYLLWGLCTASSTACGLALQAAIRGYRQVTGDDGWLKMGGRVVAFAGTTLLDSLARDRRGAIQSCAPQLRTTAAALLCKGLAGMENAELMMDAAITRQLQ